MKRGIAFVLIASLSVFLGGCAAGGLAAVGPIFSALQAIGDRSVERTVPTDVSTAAAATVDALSRMGIQVKESERGEASWKASAQGGEVTVTAQVTQVTARLSKVTLRVENGGITADKGTAEEIQKQIALSLTERTTSPRDPAVNAEAGTAAISALEGEIRRLRSEMEASRTAPRLPATQADGPPQPSVREGAVLSIPVSYGLPTQAPPSATPPPVLVQPASAASAAGASPPAGIGEEPRGRRAPAAPAAGIDPVSVLAAPLVPASVLSPIQPLTGIGSPN